ncbi:hypothetical protein [Asticcacaulis solisilvae]|uniref:hypothetical protein n=1 Tax=Asticcacaulis solisilvae TaxID=1217274 RepID=UPI003FD7D793
MRIKLRDMAYTAGMAAGGVILYIPAAIGLVVTGVMSKRKRAESRYDFDGIDELLCVPVAKHRKTDLWAQLKLAQYFTIVPGIAAVPGGCQAFSRPCLH